MLVNLNKMLHVYNYTFTNKRNHKSVTSPGALCDYYFIYSLYLKNTAI